jgi:hypothetical protein
VARINWIKGELHGKLGEIVGSEWHGKAYVKPYTKPTNPNTPGQIATRAVWQRLTQIARDLHTPLTEYTRPKPNRATLVGHFIHLNKALFAPHDDPHDDKWDPTKLVILTGPLAPEYITSATISRATYSATVQWDYAHEDADEEDKALVVVYDAIARKAAYTSLQHRGDKIAQVDCSSMRDTSSLQQLYAYLAFFNGQGDDGLNPTLNSPTTQHTVAVTTAADPAQTPEPAGQQATNKE